MSNKLSDERVMEIREDYYNAKTKMSKDIHTIAVQYFSHTANHNSLIEKTLGSLMSWANGDFDSIEDRDPKEMIAATVLRKVIFEGLLKDLVAYKYLSEEQAAEFLK